MTASDHLAPGQFEALSYNDLDSHLARTLEPQQLDAARVKHPRSGFDVKAGISRHVARPPEGEAEGPAMFNVTDHGDPLKPEYNSLEYMGGKRLGQEPIQHVYRGMSDAEWKQAQGRGYIKSDQRGTIAGWEGTNAAADPRDAVSYLPSGSAGHVAKIRVQPEDQWFTHRADQYVRTRNRVPLSRVERVIPLDKDAQGYLHVPQQQMEREA